MAVKQKRIVLDIDKFIKSPQYAQILANMQKNPTEAYKQLTILSETENPLSQASGGLGIIQELKKQVPINQEQVDAMFQPSELPEQLKQALDKDPVKTYQKIYNLYSYEPKVNKMQARSLLSATRKHLFDKGINPDDYLTKSPFWKGLEVLGNIVSIPSNSLAKIFAKDPDKVKIWGGTGWEETLRQFGANGEIQRLVEKRQKNVPLVGEEAKKLQDFDTKYGILGFIANVVGDPLLIIGAAGKAIGGVAKAGTGMSKAGTVMRAISSPLGELKKAKALSKIVSGGEFNNILKTTLTTAKTALGEQHALAPMINDALKNPELNRTAIRLIDDTSKALTTMGRAKEAGQFAKASKLMNNTLLKEAVLTRSKTFKTVRNIDAKLNNMVKNFKEKSGIRKLFVSDVPEPAKAVMDKARRASIGMQKEVAQAQANLAKSFKPVRKIISSNKNIMNALKKSELSIDDFITQAIERPKYFEKMLDNIYFSGARLAKKSGGINQEYKTITDAIRGVRNQFDDYILTETKYAGNKIKPLNLMGKEKEWDKLAKQYKELSINNPFNPDIAGIRTKLKGILNETNGGVKIFDDGVVEAMSDNMAYMLHAATPEAKPIINKFDPIARGNMGSIIRDYISNMSRPQRGLEGTAVEINKSIKSGAFQDALRAKANSMDRLLSGAVSNPDTVKDVAKQKDILNRVADNFDMIKKANVNFFDTDIGKLVGIRGSRTAKTIEQSVLYDGIKQFGSPTKQAGFVKPNLDGKIIAGLTDQYFDPDIAKAIERVWGFTKDDRSLKVLLNTLEDFQNFWKAATLTTHVATPLRNALGNTLNSFLVVDKPTYLLKSVKDIFSYQMTGKSYDLVTDTGKMVGLDTVFNEARTRGIEATTFRNIDIGRGVRGQAESAIGKAGEAVGNAFNNASDWLKSMPLAKFNDFIEGNSKMALFLTKVKEGASFDDAAKATYQALFDYSDLTQFEKEIKKVVPFFSWARKNLPLQIGKLFSEPSKALIKGTMAMGQNRPGTEAIDERQQSEYLQSKINIPTFRDNKGQQHFLMLEGLIPLMDIGSPLRAIAGNNKLRAVVDDMMASISPLLKTPIEIVANRNFAFKNELRKSPGDTTQFLGFYMAPELKAVLDDWRVLATINKALNINPNTIGIEPKDTSRAIFSFLLGNTIPYNQFYSRIVSARDAAKGIQDELTNFGGFLNKMTSIMNSGKKPTKYDTDTVIARAKAAMMAINKQFIDGKITDRQRASYLKQLIQKFIPVG